MCVSDWKPEELKLCCSGDNDSKDGQRLVCVLYLSAACDLVWLGS